MGGISLRQPRLCPNHFSKPLSFLLWPCLPDAESRGSMGRFGRREPRIDRDLSFFSCQVHSTATCVGQEISRSRSVRHHLPVNPNRSLLNLGRLAVPTKKLTDGLFSMPDMTGRPGCWTIEMNGGSSASYLARTSCVLLFYTHWTMSGSRSAFRLPGQQDEDHLHCAVEPSSSHIRCWRSPEGAEFRSQKGPTKPKNRTNSTKECSEEFEGATGHYPVKQGF